MSTDVVIVSAARTPVGSFNGALASQTAAQLGTVALKAAIERAKLSPEDINEVILGSGFNSGPGPEPSPPSRHSCRHSQFRNGLGLEPGLRFGPSRRGIGHAADCIG